MVNNGLLDFSKVHKRKTNKKRLSAPIPAKNANQAETYSLCLCRVSNFTAKNEVQLFRRFYSKNLRLGPIRHRQLPIR